VGRPVWRGELSCASLTTRSRCGGRRPSAPSPRTPPPPNLHSHTDKRHHLTQITTAGCQTPGPTGPSSARPSRPRWCTC
jgi:hypothetical protein